MKVVACSRVPFLLRVLCVESCSFCHTRTCALLALWPSFFCAFFFFSGFPWNTFEIKSEVSTHCRVRPHSLFFSTHSFDEYPCKRHFEDSRSYRPTTKKIQSIGSWILESRSLERGMISLVTFSMKCTYILRVLDILLGKKKHAKLQSHCLLET